MNGDQILIDVRDNKIKQGLLLKQSRHLKEWKERWMVLTKTYLYSFTAKGQYKQATQVVALKDIQTIKSYYKDQYKKPYTFRVESPQVNLHMSAKSNDQKWAWMTALEKMIDRVIHPETKADTYNLIRETLKMSSAARQTVQKKEQKDRKQSMDFSQKILKKLKISIDSLTVFHQVFPNHFVRESRLPEQQQTFFIIDNKKDQKNQFNQQKKSNQQKMQKVSQKIVEVPIQRIVQKIVQKVVIVPEIREKVIQKIIYKQAPKSTSNQNLSIMLKTLMLNPGQNPRPLVQFVVFLLTSKLQQYQPQVLAFLMDPQSKRFFAEVFLLMMNEQTNQQNLNAYLKFILVIYESCDEFFYTSDLKALVGILIRQIEMNRSQFNQYLIMAVLKAMSDKEWWSSLNYRRSQIKTYVKQIQAVSGPQNQYLASNLLQKL